MTSRIASSLLLLVLLPAYIGSYPINHPTGKKDRARSLPVVISQYSSVRNSKNNQPTVTIVEPLPDDVGKKIAEQSPGNSKISQSVDTEKLPMSSSHDKSTDQHHKPSQEIISHVKLTPDNASVDQGQSVTNKKTENTANDKKKDTHEVSDSEKTVFEQQEIQSENVNKPDSTTNQQDNPEMNMSADEGKKIQDAELPKEVVSTNVEKEEEGEKPVTNGSDDKTETMSEEKSHVAEPTSVDSGITDSEAAAIAIKDTAKATTDEIGVAETKDKSVDEKKPEENSDDSQIAATTPVADEKEPSPVNKQEPAVIPVKEKTEIANKSVSKDTNSVGSKSENWKNKAAADHSTIKTEVSKDTVTKNDEEHEVIQEVEAKNNEEPQIKLEETKSSKPVSSEEPKSDIGVDKESKNNQDNNQTEPTKALENSELFEEDRSFKGSLEEFSLAGIQDPGQFNKWSQLELSLGTNLDSFINDDEDDLMNENVRAERDDKKTEEKKEKEREKEKEMKEKLSEKEKIYGKPLNKETKSTKKPIVHSNDPVDEYEPFTSRRKRSQDGDQKIQRTNDKIIGDDAPEPEVFSLVPNNYPVVLPNGESTLSDKLTPETPVVVDDKSGGEPEVFSLVPSNYPVVLPSGESTLSDKLTLETLVEDDKSEGAPKVFSLVPSNYPVVLPNGDSTLSDKVANEST